MTLSYHCPLCERVSITKYDDDRIRFRTCDRCIERGCEMVSFDLDIVTQKVRDADAQLSRIVWNYDEDIDMFSKHGAITGKYMHSDNAHESQPGRLKSRSAVNMNTKIREPTPRSEAFYYR